MREFNRAMKFFFHYLKRYKPSFAIILVMTVIATYLQVKAPEYIGDALNELVKYATKFQILKAQHLPTSGASKDAFVEVIVSLILFYVFSSAATLVSGAVFSRVNALSTNRMRIGLFNKLQKKCRLNISTVIQMAIFSAALRVT